MDENLEPDFIECAIVQFRGLELDEIRDIVSESRRRLLQYDINNPDKISYPPDLSFDWALVEFANGPDYREMIRSRVNPFY